MVTLSENWKTFPERDLPLLVEAAKQAEQAGVDYIAMSEHVVLGDSAGAAGRKQNEREFDQPGNQDPRTPWPSSLILLAAFAAVTSRIKLVAGAVIPPLRHPLLLGKDLATLDLLSRGRLVVFPTVSWHEDEYRALNVSFQKRGKMLDEHLAVWRKVWNESPSSHEGEFYTFNGVHVQPKPWRKGGPQIWVTGDHLHKAALRRLVEYGDGIATLVPPNAAERQEVEAEMRRAGRDISELETLCAVSGRFADATSVADIDEALKPVPDQLRAGATTWFVKPSQFIADPAEFGSFCCYVVERIGALAA
jgi:probable F420-dependent oxidoreductase